MDGNAQNRWGKLAGLGGEEPIPKRQRFRLDRDIEADVNWSSEQTAREPEESENTGGATASTGDPNIQPESRGAPAEKPTNYDEVEAHRTSGHAEYQPWCSACEPGGEESACIEEVVTRRRLEKFAGCVWILLR